MGSRSFHRNGQFLGKGAPIVKYLDFLPWAVQKWLNRSICRFRCGLGWAERSISSIVFARWRQSALIGGHIAATWRIRLNHPYMVAILYVKLLCYLLPRPLRQSHRWASASRRILHCRHSTQYSHLVLYWSSVKRLRVMLWCSASDDYRRAVNGRHDCPGRRRRWACVQRHRRPASGCHVVPPLGCRLQDGGTRK